MRKFSDYFMTTERLGFSKWKESDIDLATKLWGDSEVTKYICSTGAFTKQEIADRLQKEMENQKEFGMQYWPVFQKETNEFIGCCGLRPYNLKGQVYEIGFHLTKASWGNGYAGEAALKVISYAFTYFNATELFAGHNPNNENSKKILQKIGFVYTGDEFYVPTGLYHPSYKLRPGS